MAAVFVICPCSDTSLYHKLSEMSVPVEIIQYRVSFFLRSSDSDAIVYMYQLFELMGNRETTGQIKYWCPHQERNYG